jgi:hypothetical protein
MRKFIFSLRRKNSNIFMIVIFRELQYPSFFHRRTLQKVVRQYGRIHAEKGAKNLQA